MKESTRIKRGWMALAAAVVIGLTGTGGYLVYANTLPTSVYLNVGNGQKEVAADTHLVFTFNRSVTAASVAAALTISPTTDGTLAAVAGSQTKFEWVPKQGFADLTAYTVTLKSFQDTTKHAVK